MTEQNINVSKYKPLSGSSYIKLPKELNHSGKCLVNIQNIDAKECLKWCLARFLNPKDQYPSGIRKIDTDFARKYDFKEIKFPVTIRDTHKIDRKSVSASMFLVIKIEKNCQSTFQKIILKEMLIIDRKRKPLSL